MNDVKLLKTNFIGRLNMGEKEMRLENLGIFYMSALNNFNTSFDEEQGG